MGSEMCIRDSFKAEVKVSDEELIENARAKMKKYNLAMVVANDLANGGMGTVDNEVYILRRGEDEVKYMKGAKAMIAVEIINELSGLL